MRVQLTPVQRPGHRDEQGAVAVVVAICLVVLLGFAAFAVDFGLAYSSKRQLQTSADAAVLAAASIYTVEPGDCGTLAADAALKTTARDVATAVMDDNHGEAVVVGDIVVECDPAGSGRLHVSWQNEDDTDASLGGAVFGASDITSERAATAEVGVASRGTGLRPFAICSAAIPDDLPSALVRVDYNGFVSTGQCPEGHNSGNWWTLDCPHVPGVEPPSSGNALLVWRIENVCASPLDVVEGQEPFYGDPVQLSNHLLARPTPCPGGVVDEDCLGTDTGNIRSNGVRTAWQNLLGDTITFPVICGSYSVGTRPTCNPDAVHSAGGANVEYPIHAFTGAIVCGFHFGNNGSRRNVTTGECAGSDALMLSGANQNYLVMKFTNVQLSGGVDPVLCALDDVACDYGARFARLVH